MKRLLKWIAILFGLCVVLGVIAAIANGNKSGTTTPDAAPAVAQAPQTTPAAQVPATSAPAAAPKSTNAPVPTNTPKPQPTPTPVPGLGTEVVSGKVAWTVTKAEKLGTTLKSTNQFIDSKTTSGIFLRVTYHVENRGGDKVYYQTPKLVDSQNRKFSDASGVTFWIPEAETCLLQELNPNVPKTCTAIYEIAAGANGLKAEVTGLALLTGSALIDLGLDGGAS